MSRPTSMSTGKSTKPVLSPAELQGRISLSPFSQWANIQVDSFGAEGLVMSLTRRDEMLGSPHTGALHGGLLGAMVDSAGGFTLIGQTGQTIATVDFRVNFHRPSMAAHVRARTRIVHNGRSMGTVAVEVFDVAADGNERLVASGQGVYLHVLLDSLKSAKPAPAAD